MTVNYSLLLKMLAFKIFRRQFAMQDVLNALQSGFGSTLPEMKVIEAKNGKLVFDLKIGKEHLNSINRLDAGFVATLIDTGCVCSLLTHEKRNLTPSATIDMHFGYFKEASVGDEIVVDVKALHINKALGFLECEIRNKTTNDLLAKGSQALAAVK